MESSATEAAAARAAATSLTRELALLRRQWELDKVRLEAALAGLQADVAAERGAAAAARAERDRLAAALQVCGERRRLWYVAEVNWSWLPSCFT